MVAILPPNTNLGSEIGQSLGRGLETGLSQGIQRGQTQQALEGLKLPEGASPFDLAKALISATAGIPGAERYVGQLFPLLLQQMQSKAAFQKPETPETQGKDGAAIQIPQPSGGYLGNVYSQEQIKKASEDYAKKIGGGLEAKESKSRELLAESDLAQTRRKEIEQKAMSRFPELQTHPELYSRFSNSIAKFPKETDPERLLEKGYRDFQNEIANLTKLQARNLERIEDFNTLAPTLQDLEKEGLGSQARKYLISKNLRPYQFSHLFTKEGERQEKEAASFKPAKDFSKVSGLAQEKMADFLKDLLNSESPLPSIAFDLYEKGYSWLLTC